MIPGILPTMQRTKLFSSTVAGSVPRPLFFRGSQKQKELEEQEQKNTRRTWTTHRNNIYQDRGRRCALPPRPPPAFFRPFPCCLDNNTKQAEPQPQPLSQQQQETCRGIVLTFAPLCNNKTNKKKKAQNDKKKQEETRRR